MNSPCKAFIAVLASTLVAMSLSSVSSGTYASTTSPLQADDGHTTTPAQSINPVQPINLGVPGCPRGEERFLPGDYYLCAASYRMTHGHYKQAVEMFHLAAGWGSKTAQYTLGTMYFNGRYVPLNRPLGLAWLTLAAERNNDIYRAVLLSANNLSSIEEWDEAEQLLLKMRPKYADAHAAARAKRHYDRAYRQLLQDQAYSRHVCVAGITFVNEDPSMSWACPPMIVVSRKLNQMATDFFAGWEGVVTVGRPIPVEPPPAAAESAPRDPR